MNVPALAAHTVMVVKAREVAAHHAYVGHLASPCRKTAGNHVSVLGLTLRQVPPFMGDSLL